MRVPVTFWTVVWGVSLDPPEVIIRPPHPELRYRVTAEQACELGRALGLGVNLSGTLVWMGDTARFEYSSHTRG